MFTKSGYTSDSLMLEKIVFFVAKCKCMGFMMILLDANIGKKMKRVN
jgi:hypothetical protein